MEKERKNASVQPWIPLNVHVQLKPSGEDALFLPGPEGPTRKHGETISKGLECQDKRECLPTARRQSQMLEKNCSLGG